MNQGAQKTFGQYTIQQKLGAGGMGVVYKAFDNKLQRVVAIKMITNQDSTTRDIERFLREAQSMAKLNHPNIIEIYDIGGNPKPFIAMEFLEGNDLSTLFKAREIKTPQLIKIITDIAKALIPTHKAGIIHRDIKPANIMVTNDNVAKLMDFGLAKTDKEEQGLSKSGSVIGTPAYMPPEQVAGKVKPTNDIYSLGASLYEGLTGRPPFVGESYVNMLSQIILGEPIPPRDLNPDISVYLEAICLKCMSKKPQKRYQKAEELVSDLQNFSKNRPIKAKPYTKADKIKKTISQNKGIFSLIFLSFFLIFVCCCILYSSKETLQSKNVELNIEKEKLENFAFQVFSHAADLLDYQNTKHNLELAKRLTHYMKTLGRLGPEKLFTKNEKIAQQYFLCVFTGSNQQKIEKYSEIISKDKFIIALTSRIQCYIDAKEYQKAKDDCSTVRKLNPKINIVHYFEAKISFREKKYKKALEQIQKMFTTQVENHRVYRLRGAIYQKLGKYQLAVEDLTTSLQKKSDSLTFFYRGFCYFYLKKYQKALSDYNKAISLNPEDYNAQFQRILVYKELGKKEKIITESKDLAPIFLKQKRYQKAIDLWKMAIAAGGPRKQLRKKIKKTKQLRAKK
ncbi:protein kinase [Candidatus Uabimicrobium sp. HlEnr_7]|uniref:serine/threonine-protein kinase n=1 Tax=Candidatus Uabimicrobium helgolandensis TaxID=3095367 RepID=UPI003559328A